MRNFNYVLDRVEREIEEIMGEKKWTPQHAKALEELLMCEKCVKEIEKYKVKDSSCKHNEKYALHILFNEWLSLKKGTILDKEIKASIPGNESDDEYDEIITDDEINIFD